MGKSQENILRNFYAILPPLIIAGLFYIYFSSGTNTYKGVEHFCDKGPITYPHIRMLDTIYLTGDEYIEIKLKKQLAVLHRRNDSSITYKISTGTNRLAKGVKTPPGFYTIQTKLEVAVSKQFNNAKLFYWMGFNGNIGFHGLQSSGYYMHLGRRPSSHGCVRIAREDAKSLFKKVHRGTPVIVHQVPPAVRIVFADYTEFNPEYDFFLSNDSKLNNTIMKTRLKYLREGLALTYNTGRPFIDGRTIMKPRGFDIGIDSLIPDRQLPPLYKTKLLCPGTDILKLPRTHISKEETPADSSGNKDNAKHQSAEFSFSSKLLIFNSAFSRKSRNSLVRLIPSS